MPQITIEYTSNISMNFDKSSFLSQINQLVHQEGKSNLDNCKSRLIRLDDYFVGNSSTNAFVHLTLQFLQGRDTLTKNNLGNALLTYLEETFLSENRDENIQITVHIVDIDKESYFKYPKGTFTQL